MRRAAVFTVVLALAVVTLAFAQAKPDFSGTWTLDPTKSEMGGPGGGGGGRGAGPAGPMALKQTATELVRETKRGEQTMTANYKLDGTETSNTMGPMTAKSKANWDSDKLVIKTVRETPNGTMETTETYSLSADGKELTIVSSSARGERKMVYTKG